MDELEISSIEDENSEDANPMRFKLKDDPFRCLQQSSYTQEGHPQAGYSKAGYPQAEYNVQVC